MSDDTSIDNPEPIDDDIFYPECEDMPLHIRLNACDYCRYRLLAPIGDGIAYLWDTFTHGTDCPCCLGTRLLSLVALVALVTTLIVR